VALLFSCTLRADLFTMEVHFSKAEVISVVLARVGSSAGAHWLGMAVSSSLRASHMPMQVHLTKTLAVSVVLARLRCIAVAFGLQLSFRSRRFDCLQRPTFFSSAPDMLVRRGVMVFIVV
jgi:hypothetical protein